MADERQQQEEFNKKVIEKIESDPDFLGHLLQNPEETLQKAGLEDQANAMEKDEGAYEEGEEVSGHWYTYPTYHYTCKWPRRGRWWHRL